MSMQAYRWALTWDGLSSPEKFVLVMIADYYNDTVHRSWPSIARLAQRTALHRTTVINALKKLEEHGLIVKEPWAKPEGAGYLNTRYCLPMYDPKSERAKVIPVLAYKEFDNEGSVTYDTFPHQFQNGEEVPGYAA